MATLQQLIPINVDSFLDTEEKGELRHEFVNGVVYAMVGASARHNLIAGSLFANLRSHLKGSQCRTFQSDMKVRVEDIFYYPDVVVSCGKLSPTDRYINDPILIIEVLSPSTESKDRLEKMVTYRNLSSLQEYVLVSQDKVQIEIYRKEDTAWLVETLGAGDIVKFMSTGLTLKIEEVYEDITGL